MYFSFFVALTVVSTISASVIELTSYEDRLLYVSYRIAGFPVGPFSAYLVHNREELEPGRRLSAGCNLTFATIDDHQITTSNLVHNFFGVSLIPVGFQSDFARHVAMTYMMIPSNRQLIINPDNPREFVFDGRLTTTRSTSDDHLQVRCSVSLGSRPSEEDAFVPLSLVNSTEVHEFTISTGITKDHVPFSVIQALYDELRRREIRLDRGSDGHGNMITFDIIGDLTDEILNTFPILQYRIHTDSGIDIGIELSGLDYIGPLEDNRRELLLLADGVFGLGSNSLFQIALFVDNRNRTIGFGNPL